MWNTERWRASPVSSKVSTRGGDQILASRVRPPASAWESFQIRAHAPWTRIGSGEGDVMVVEGNGRADSITIGVCVMEKKVGGILPPFGSRTLVFFSFSSSSLLFFLGGSRDPRTHGYGCLIWFSFRFFFPFRSLLCSLITYLFFLLDVSGSLIDSCC